MAQSNEQGEAMNTLLSDEELRKEPQDELEQILSDMAFRCAGGITHSGRKEYMPAKEAITNLFVSQFLEALGESSTHYQRTCMYCGATWLGLHCVHDGYQNPCPNCDRKPVTIDYHDCICMTVIDMEQIKDTIGRSFKG